MLSCLATGLVLFGHETICFSVSKIEVGATEINTVQFEEC